MKLCGASLSPYYERAYLVTKVKGDEAGLVEPGMPFEMKSEAHFAANPLGRIPVLLLDDGSSLIESQVIAEYLDAVLPGESLMRSDPQETARVSLFCRLVDMYFAPVMERFWVNRGFSEDEQQKAIETDLPAAWDTLEHFVDGHGYAVGTRFSLADLALIPWLFHLRTFASRRGDAGVTGRVKLEKWMQTAGESDLAQASFKRSEKSFEFLKDRLKAAQKAS